MPNLVSGTIDKLKSFFANSGQTKSLATGDLGPVTPNMPTPQPTPSPAPDPFGGFRGSQVPNQYKEPILRASSASNIDPNLLASLLFHESGIRPEARNVNPGTGSVDRGIAQLNTQAFPNVTDQQAYDPNFAIPFAADLLRQNINHFGGDINRGVAAYNVGRGGANVQGNTAFGGGERGQKYIDAIAHMLAPEVIKSLGLKPSKKLIEEFVSQ